MLSGNDDACVAIALALCFTVVESDSGNFVYHNTLQNLMTVLMLSDPQMISKFLFARFDVPSFDVILKTVNRTDAKEVLTPDRQSSFIHYAVLFGHRK